MFVPVVYVLAVGVLQCRGAGFIDNTLVASPPKIPGRPAGDRSRLGHILVPQRRVDDLVAVPGGIGRFAAARSVCLSSGLR